MNLAIIEVGVVGGHGREYFNAYQMKINWQWNNRNRSFDAF